jgi:virulence-associated protein VapD
MFIYVGTQIKFVGSFHTKLKKIRVYTLEQNNEVEFAIH